jgi:hypothetical protein
LALDCQQGNITDGRFDSKNVIPITSNNDLPYSSPGTMTDVLDIAFFITKTISDPTTSINDLVLVFETGI